MPINIDAYAPLQQYRDDPFQPIPPLPPTFDFRGVQQTPNLTRIRGIRAENAPDIMDTIPGVEERSDLVGKILRKNKVTFANRPSPEWVLPDTMIGFELEIENVGRPPGLMHLDHILPPNLQRYWHAHEDGSLHNRGCEFTFRQPLFGEDLRIALQEMFEFVNAQKGWTCSLRTGIHIHLDARDLTRHQLLGLVSYYVLFEPALYMWVGAGRNANNFCVPWYKYEGSLDQAERILRSMRRFAEGEKIASEAIIEECIAFHRYAGLNLKALAEFGSMEFRHLETTKDYETVRDWINVIMSLKKAAMDAPESTATIIYDVERRGVSQSLERIFGQRAVERMNKQESGYIEEITTNCIPNALNLITAVTVDKTFEQKDRNWEELLARPVENPHPGFVAWRKEHYPKGEKPDLEEKPPPEF